MGELKPQIPSDPDLWEAQLIDIVATMLSHRWRKSQIKAMVYPALEQAGRKRDATFVEYLITQAKAQLVVETGVSREEHRRNAIALYESLIRDENATVDTQLRAQARLDVLLGLEERGDRIEGAEETAAKIRKALLLVDAAYDDVPTPA